MEIAFTLMILAFLIQTVNLINCKKRIEELEENAKRVTLLNVDNILSIIYQLKEFMTLNAKIEAENRLIEEYSKKRRELSNRVRSSTR